MHIHCPDSSRLLPFPHMMYTTSSTIEFYSVHNNSSRVSYSKLLLLPGESCSLCLEYSTSTEPSPPATTTMQPSTHHFIQKVFTAPEWSQDSSDLQGTAVVTSNRTHTLYCYLSYLLSPQCTISSMTSRSNVCSVQHFVSRP